MQMSSFEHHELLSKIHGALALLDPTGTNETVTQAMAIVYEAFKYHKANIPLSANELLMVSSNLKNESDLQ